MSTEDLIDDRNIAIGIMHEAQAERDAAVRLANCTALEGAKRIIYWRRTAMWWATVAILEGFALIVAGVWIASS